MLREGWEEGQERKTGAIAMEDCIREAHVQ